MFTRVTLHRRLLRVLLLAALALSVGVVLRSTLAGPSKAPVVRPVRWLVSEAAAADAPGVRAVGVLRLLTYNVAGLPTGVSQSRPAEFMPLIARQLDSFDLVLLQEDFFFHDALVANVALPFRSAPARPEPSVIDLGDGLNRFGNLAFAAVERFPWSACHSGLLCGNDCLADKGFSVARTELAPGVEVDVYNVHLDAGTCDGDDAARSAQVSQLLGVIAARSADVPVIVAGDFNLSAARPVDAGLLARFVEEGAMTDACGRRPHDCAMLDHVLVRGTSTVAMQVLGFQTPRAFKTADGQDLSDHLPVAVDLEWRRLDGPEGSPFRPARTISHR